LESTINKIET